ncbi:hypothetical protein [Roseateles sp.]|uniref:hypothetical protein n=1 Tax=Roseateles sp. TaxID=1971397 RepID=UPI002DF861C8|nr:hypothetical protein [Roseateles sp.]
MDAKKLEGLGGFVDEIDAEDPARQAEQQAQEQAEQQAQTEAEKSAREWGSIVFMVGRALCMVAPELKAVYTEEACLQWGESVVPVAQKYGWDGPGAVPEIGLAISTLGLAVPSYLVIRVKLAQLKAAREAADARRRAEDEARTVDSPGGAA